MNKKKEINKKRKRDIITQLGGTVENESLQIKIPDYIPCIICKTPVYNYQCVKEVLCSYDCFSVYTLSQQDSFIDEKTIRRSSFDNVIKKSDEVDDLMTLDGTSYYDSCYDSCYDDEIPEEENNN